MEFKQHMNLIVYIGSLHDLVGFKQQQLWFIWILWDLSSKKCWVVILRDLDGFSGIDYAIDMIIILILFFLQNIIFTKSERPFQGLHFEVPCLCKVHIHISKL